MSYIDSKYIVPDLPVWAVQCNVGVIGNVSYDIKHFVLSGSVLSGCLILEPFRFNISFLQLLGWKQIVLYDLYKFFIGVLFYIVWEGAYFSVLYFFIA